MNGKYHVLEEVFDYLNKHSKYAVLRNYQDLPLGTARDIDIIIERRDFNIIRIFLFSVFQTNGYNLILYYKGSEMYSMVFANCNEGYCSIVSFDFLFSIYVRDLVLYTADQVLSDRQYNGKIYHVRKDWEYLAKYTYNIILGHSYPAKYKEIQKEAETLYSHDVKKQLDSIGLSLSIDKIRLCKIRCLLFRKRFFISLIALFRYLYYSLCNALFPQGISMGFTGPDGSGKTTVINYLRQELSAVFTNLNLFHFRPTLYGNLGDVAYSTGVKKSVDHEYEKPHRGTKTGVVSSLIRLLYYSLDYFFGNFLICKPKLFKRGIVIFDRYYTDIICDSRRSRIYLPLKFLYWWGRCFIPSLDYNILLTARTETILERKQELDSESVEAINMKIDYLADKPSFYKVMNEGTPQEAVAEILRIVFEKQHKKNMKRLS